MSAPPQVSVIVPVFEQWHLAPLLCAGLNGQDIAADRYEVLLVDNGSRMIEVPSNLPPNARILTCAQPGSYAARNAGLAEARADWLLFTDADCRPEPNWISTILEASRRLGPSTLLAGPVRMLAGSADPNIYEIYDLVRGIPQERYVRRGYAATANLAVHRSVFAAAGPFDGRRFSGGDAEFCRRARAAGNTTALVPGAYVGHPCRSSWAEIETKARRVRGGQVAPGSLRRHKSIVAVAILSPLKGIWTLMRARPHSLRYRLLASLVLLRVWWAEISETIRLSFGATPERR
ncbi:MAG: glycosyltransferase [Devosia nanyangense]|uniref:Glycosyltransferase n=1 Tax=Devosia nanyangense TaxID=1228055 RepID=A0A933KZ90_9HYPH|nr:glycosyltransferase [Devosia nanyangense]